MIHCNITKYDLHNNCKHRQQDYIIIISSSLISVILCHFNDRTRSMKSHFPGCWVVVVTATDKSLGYAAHHRLLLFNFKGNIFGYDCIHTRLYLYNSCLRSFLWSLSPVYNHAFVCPLKDRLMWQKLSDRW